MKKIQKEFYVLNWKEYTLEQLDQLRAEYNFLVSDIEEKEKYKGRLEKNIIKCGDIIRKEREDFEEEKRKIIFENNKLKKELEDKIKSVDTEIKEKETKNNILLEEIKKQQSILDDKSREILQDTSLLLEEKEEFERKSWEVLSSIDEREKQIKIDRKKAKEMLDEWKRLIKEYEDKKKMIDEWEKEYKRQKEWLATQHEEINVKWAVIEKTQKENSIERKQLDKDIEKNAKMLQDIDSKSSKLEEKLEDLKNREWELAKNITEFRETKYQFLVIMKQKGISKLDIEKLDKEFSI